MVDGTIIRMENYLRRHCFNYQFIQGVNGDVLALFNESGKRVYSVVRQPQRDPYDDDPFADYTAEINAKPLLLIDHVHTWNDVRCTMDECVNKLHRALETGIIARKLN